MLKRCVERVAPAGRGVICEVTPIGLLAYFVEFFSLTELTDLTEPFCALFNSWGVLSFTDLTDLTDPFCAQFRSHRTPPAYRYHRTFQLKVAVTLCEIGWLNVSVECCVFCSSVFLCEKKNNCETHWGGFSLIELAATSPPNPFRMARGVGYEAMPRRTGQQGKGCGQLFSACSPCSQKGFCSSVKICER